MTHVSIEMHIRNGHEFLPTEFSEDEQQYDSIQSIFICYILMYLLSHSLLLLQYCLT